MALKAIKSNKMNIFELVKTKNDEGLTLTEMRFKHRMKIAIKAWNKTRNYEKQKTRTQSK